MARVATATAAAAIFLGEGAVACVRLAARERRWGKRRPAPWGAWPVTAGRDAPTTGVAAAAGFVAVGAAAVVFAVVDVVAVGVAGAGVVVACAGVVAVGFAFEVGFVFVGGVVSFVGVVFVSVFGGMATLGVFAVGVVTGGILTGGMLTGGISIGGMLTGGIPIPIGGIVTGGTVIGGLLAVGEPGAGMRVSGIGMAAAAGMHAGASAQQVRATVAARRRRVWVRGGFARLSPAIGISRRSVGCSNPLSDMGERLVECRESSERSVQPRKLEDLQHICPCADNCQPRIDIEPHVGADQHAECG